MGGGLQSQPARGGEGEALRAPGAGLIPISWRGANVHAIYCMTASHISINPLHEAGNRGGGAAGPTGSECVQIRREETRKETRKPSKQRKMKHQRKTRRQRSKSQTRQGSEVLQQRLDRPGPTLRGTARAWRTGPVATSAHVIRIFVFTSCLITFRWRREGCQASDHRSGLSSTTCTFESTG